MKYFCCDNLRRERLQALKAPNGIDYLEVVDHPKRPEQQQIFLISLINELTGIPKVENIHIEGGERISDVKVTTVTPLSPTLIEVTVNKPGDFSVYTLSITGKIGDGRGGNSMDPLLSKVDFSFKVSCPSDFDCLTRSLCPPVPLPEPEIDYLAKDYSSFRRLMLDRMAVLMPEWQERSPADLGVALVELLAYVGDYLSYQQDAVATEAYLGTARKRVSVRRHARLVDYHMHNGCNARVWIQVSVNADNVAVKKGTPILTPLSAQNKRIDLNLEEEDGVNQFRDLLSQKPEVFEVLDEKAVLYSTHNRISFHTWGGRDCCLPKGAVRATLAGNLPNLKSGDVLIFMEVTGARTGHAADADPAKRHAVRLTQVTPGQDPIGGNIQDPRINRPVPLDVTEIQWDKEDALPFSLCVSNHGSEGEEEVSIALGNVVLADHGYRIEDKKLGVVPKPSLYREPLVDNDRCQHREPETVPQRFYPQLKDKRLTFIDPYDATGSAAQAMDRRVEKALPGIIELSGHRGTQSEQWQPQRDLLNSGVDKREYVVEMESDGTAYLRFGDDQFGARPKPDTQFEATYRVGNGKRGNVGAEALRHIVSTDSRIVDVSNPIPARGGTEPESMEEVRQRAPNAFRCQERAVTSEDYVAVASRHPQVQGAAATVRWTGSWHTIFLAVDRKGGEKVNPEFEMELRRFLDRYRMAGHDLEIEDPHYVYLEIDMTVCIEPNHFRSQVGLALLRRFSRHTLPDGSLGIFHPDHFTFQQAVYLSPLYAAAEAVAGVASVNITKFQRLGIKSTEALERGKLELGRLEVARLDNDPNFPEHGVFRLTLEGGK